MASRKERFVGIFEFSLRVSGHPDHPAELFPHNFAKLKAVLDKHKAADKPLSSPIDGGQILICLDDIGIDKSQIALLFTVVDADAADAVYRDMKSGKEKQFRKGPDEGGAASAHLVIDLASAANSYRYKAGLEDIEGVSRSRILPFLQHLMRASCGAVSTVIEDEIFTGEAVLELQSVHRDRLENAAGRPVSVDLIMLQPKTKIDSLGGDRYREVKVTREFVIDRKSPIESAMAALKSIRKRQQTEFADFPMMRIRWKRPDDKVQTLRVDDLADDLMQRAFTRVEVVTGFHDLVSATKDIRADLVAKMFAAIR